MNPPPKDWNEALDGLLVDREDWLSAARAALEHAHSPYSDIRVGAALVDRSGQIFSGCNVENASYGLTICAERNAIGRAVMEGARDLVAIAIISSLEAPLLPCGACRQVLMEFAPDLIVLCEGADGSTLVHSLRDLLPQAFEPGDLGG